MKLSVLGYRSESGGERVARKLCALGIDTVFSIAGSQTLPVADALERFGVRLVCPRNERNGAFMAEGYGRAAGFPAVAMSTLGPGVANEPVALHSALASRAPLLCVNPCQPARKRGRLGEVFQGLDHPAFLSGVCKRSFLVEQEEEIDSVLEPALAACRAEPPGPVRVDIAFPLLFERRWTRAEEPAPFRRVRREVRFVLVGEDERAFEALDEIGGPEVLRLVPGIGEPGFAVPVAVGAKLGALGASVVVATGGEQLLANLDSILVARMSGIRVEIAAPEGGLGGRVARALGVALVERPTREVGVLSIVCPASGEGPKL